MTVSAGYCPGQRLKLIVPRARCASIPWHFVGIELNQPQVTIADMVGLINTRTDLDSSDQKIAGNHESEVALHGWPESPSDDRGVVDPGDGGGDVKFQVDIVEEFNGDPGKWPGSCIFQDVKEWNVEFNFSIAKHPGLSRSWTLGDRGRIGNFVPQALWPRRLAGPRHLAEHTAQQ